MLGNKNVRWDKYCKQNKQFQPFVFIQQPQNITRKMNRAKSTRNLTLQKSSSAHRIQSKSRPHSTLSSLLLCLICKQMIKSSHMCPHCSKLFCQNCIKNWVVTKKSECPNCFHSLRLTMIVNCSQLGKELEEAIHVMERENEMDELLSDQYEKPNLQDVKSSPEIVISCDEITCSTHGIKLDYYCETCRKGICSDCAVLTDTHRYHKICKLSQKKQLFFEEVETIKSKVENLRHGALKAKEDKLEHISKIKSKQNNDVKQFQNHLKKVVDSINSKSSDTIKNHEQIFTAVFQIHVQQTSLYNNFLEIVKNSTKCSLIRNYFQLEEEIESHTRKKIELQKLKKYDSQSEIAPEYEHKVFVLDNYSYLKQKRDILYSEVFYLRGIEWRLKIYPGGLAVESEEDKKKELDQYLAIYLQMSKGHEASLKNTYRYKIQLINQEDGSQRISRIFESQFEEGLCWGYDTFAKISTLYDEKYVHPTEDTLQIILHIKSPTYYHAVRDQNYRISLKNKELEHNLQRIRDLRKEIGHDQIMNGKQEYNSRTVQALIDESESNKPSIRRIKSNYDIVNSQRL